MTPDVPQKILSTNDQPRTVPRNPELAWINGYFSGNKGPWRFNGFGLSNDHKPYFNSLLHPESDFTRACVSVEWVAFAEIAQDMDMVYVPCGISSGLRAHEEIDEQNKSRPSPSQKVVTTYQAAEPLGADKHGAIIKRNRADNLDRASVVSRLHSDKMIIAPVIREGAVRELTRTGAFSHWQKYEEEDYMAFWYPVIDRCKGMMLDGDWNYSRNSIWEMMRGVLIQAGQVPSRPMADMEVFDLEDHPMSLLARTQKLTETLQYQLGKGFEAREAATALAQIFTLDEEIRAGTTPGKGVLLHKILKDRPSEELAAMDALKAKFKPVILSQCAHYMRVQDLPEEYRIAARAKPRGMAQNLMDSFQAFAQSISDHASKVLSVLATSALLAKLAENDYKPRRPFDSYERFFEKSAQAKIFEDDLYGNLSGWEKIALPFAIGATETGLYPAAKPMATMILSDLKRGEVGFHRAGAQSDMNEIAGVLGKNMREVISANAEAAEQLKVRLKTEEPGRIVVNCLSFLRIADTIGHFRKMEGAKRFIRSPGTSQPGPQMRLALQMKYLDRNVDRAVFQDGWAYSGDLVQLRVRARLIQAGLVKRPGGPQSPMHLFDAADPKLPKTLLEDIEVLSKEVRRAIEANTPETEQAVALARLIALHELIVDPLLQEVGIETSRELINHSIVDASLTCYDREAAKAICGEAKKLIMQKAALWMPHERMHLDIGEGEAADIKAAKLIQNYRMQDYIEARKALSGEDRLNKTRPSGGGLYVGKHGVIR